MTDIKSRLVDGVRGQGIRLPDGDWLRLDDNNLGLIAERLLRTPGIAIVDADATERVAEAIFKADEVSHYVPQWGDGLHESLKSTYRGMARAALAAAAQEPK